jgi:mRNA-degrading endonuclease YafQ of YafQ-DinJ toxin-antitoxin module
VTFHFKASETFWKRFYGLNASQKESVRRAWRIFKENPFDPRLKSHKIHVLSAKSGKTIYSAAIEDDLRVIFFVEGNTVYTVDLGTHAIYRT